MTEDTNHFISTRIGWFLMEFPALLLFSITFMSRAEPQSVYAWGLLFLWAFHYIHRSLIYPLQIQVSSKNRIPVMVVAQGAVFCGLNGFANAYWISYLNTDDFYNKIQFFSGVLIFFTGFAINKHSDHILHNLRRGEETDYKIPYGGLYAWVSMPNYLGEIITWTGFAIAAWSPPSFIFLLMTVTNLVPRAIVNHQWYKQKFQNYPNKRKAILPYIL
jgi:hypothetical protein